MQAIVDDMPDLPSGKAGYYFTENGSQSWKTIADDIGKAGNGLGVFETDEVGSIGLEEVAREFFDGNLRDAEGVLGSK